MNTARIKPMPASALATITDPCGGCAQARSSTTPRWAAETAARWGMCGLSAQNDDATLGFLTLTAAELVPDLVLPGWAGHTAPQLHTDAAVILNVAVCADYRGQHIGRDLVRAAAAQMVKRQVGIIEVIATSGAPVRLVPDDVGDGDRRREHQAGFAGCGPGPMLLPVGFWLAVGFRVVRAHPVAPTLRMDLSATERRLPDFAGAWQRFAERLSHPSPPHPAHFQDKTGAHRRPESVTR